MAPSRNKESIVNIYLTTFLQQRSLTPTIACSCAPVLFTLITAAIHTLRHDYTPTFSVRAPQ